MSLLAFAVVACSRADAPEDKPLPPAPPAASSGPTAAGDPSLPPELKPNEPQPETVEEEKPDEPLVVGPPKAPEWDGPHLVVTRISAGVYSKPEFDRKKKIGYVRNGGKIAVKKDPVSKESCKQGWYEVVGGGFICANTGTLNAKDSKLKFVLKQPNLDEVLPYTYARNAKHGTPLYKSVPTPDQMYGYEPYLEAAKKHREKKAAEARAQAEAEAKAKAAEASARAAEARAKAKADAAEDSSDSAVKPASAKKTTPASDPPRSAKAAKDGDEKATDSDRDSSTKADDQEERAATEEPTTPWWQEESEDANLHQVTLEDMQSEADDVLAARMMKGFYVAIDKTFRWNDRLWYKTTKGLVAPADRFWQVAGSKFQGVELGEAYSLPLGFVYGSSKQQTLYALDSDSQLKPDGSIQRMEAINLTGQTRKIGKNEYHETKNGKWIKSYALRVASKVDDRDDIKDNERWLDINVSTQTLVAYVGNRPVYATMVSSGKESKVKAKDHRTPRGEWRIREKHLATTMDGDGTAAGDLPYSIEDVPFVSYFHRSYAVHAAFWHRNYGVRMSHGCVNLSPLDAKWVFFFADPQLPAGWHGVWSTESNPGSRVVVHE